MTTNYSERIDKNKFLSFCMTVVMCNNRKFFSLKMSRDATSFLVLDSVSPYLKDMSNADIFIERKEKNIRSGSIVRSGNHRPFPIFQDLDKFLDNEELSPEKLEIGDVVRFVLPDRIEDDQERKRQRLLHITWFFDKIHDQI